MGTPEVEKTGEKENKNNNQIVNTGLNILKKIIRNLLSGIFYAFFTLYIIYNYSKRYFNYKSFLSFKLMNC